MIHTQYITTCKRENLFFPQFFPLIKNFRSSVDVLLDIRVCRAMIRLKMIKIKTSIKQQRKGGWFPNDHINNVWREDNSYAS